MRGDLRPELRHRNVAVLVCLQDVYRGQVVPSVDALGPQFHSVFVAQLCEALEVVVDYEVRARQAEVVPERLAVLRRADRLPRERGEPRYRIIPAALPEFLGELLRPCLVAAFPRVYEKVAKRLSRVASSGVEKPLRVVGKVPVQRRWVHLVAFESASLRRGGVVLLSVRRVSEAELLPVRLDDGDLPVEVVAYLRLHCAADLLPDELLHRKLGRDPWPARLAPSVAVRRANRDAEPFRLVKRKAEEVEPLLRRELDRGHRALVYFADVLLRDLREGGELAAERTVRVEYRRARDPREFHRLEVLRNALARDVSVHPVPPCADAGRIGMPHIGQERGCQRKCSGQENLRFHAFHLRLMLP